MNIKVYVITHKKFKEPNNQIYLPLSVGNVYHNELGYCGDDTGNNISKKNKNYCELTGLYWIWKNDKKSDVVGISHYRRYFIKGLFSRSKKRILDYKKISKYLKKYDIILPKKETYKEIALEQFCLSSGHIDDLYKTRKIISELYPDYVESFDLIMNQNKMYQYNMLITTKKIYDDYCKWLFDILFELEKRVDLSNGYTEYQKRIYGFISERLLNVWVYQKKLKVKERRVINTDATFHEILKINLRRIKNKLIYFFRRV